MSVLSLVRRSLCLPSHCLEGAYVCPLIGQKYLVSVPSLVCGNQPLDSIRSVGTCVVTVLSLVRGTIVCASISIFHQCCQECPLLHLVMCPSLSAQLVLVCVVDVVVDGVPQASVRSDRVVVQLAPQVVLGLLQLHYLVPQLCQLGVQSFLLLCQLHLV